MQILFDRSHPKYLLEALKLVHKLDQQGEVALVYYDKSIDEQALNKPVLFLFDYSKKGLEVTTEKYYSSGYRVFALKTKRGEKLNFFELSLTVLSVWPKVLNILTKQDNPFVYTYKTNNYNLKRIA